MKRLFIIMALALSIGCSATIQAQTKFIPIKERAAKVGQVFKTDYTYGEGTQDTIYLSTNGKAFVNKISKNGRRYRKYLDPDTSKQLCKEYNKEYKETERESNNKEKNK